MLCAVAPDIADLVADRGNLTAPGADRVHPVVFVALVFDGGVRVELREVGVGVGERGEPMTDYVVSVSSFQPFPGSPDVIGPAPKEQPVDRGPFRLDGLGPGLYVLSAEAPGMLSSESDPIGITPGRAVGGVRMLLSPQPTEAIVVAGDSTE